MKETSHFDAVIGILEGLIAQTEAKKPEFVTKLGEFIYRSPNAGLIGVQNYHAYAQLQTYDRAIANYKETVRTLERIKDFA